MGNEERALGASNKQELMHRCTKQGPRTQVKRGPGMNSSANVIPEVTQRTRECGGTWDVS